MSQEQPSDLAPNTDAMWAFISWWFEQCRHGMIEVGWTVPSEDRGIRHFKKFALEDEAIVAFAAELNLAGCNVYIRASTIAGDAPIGRTTDLFVVETPGAWVDLDTLEQLEAARKVAPILRPNAWVITGRHPHLRMQPWYRFTTPITDREVSRSLNIRLSLFCGSDPAVVNPSRLMRLPGSIAWPMKEGRIPELTEFVLPDDGRPSVYPVHQVDQLLPKLEPGAPGVVGEDWGPTPDASPQPTPPIGSPGVGGGLGISPEAELARKVRAGDQWHNNLLKLVAHWVGAGYSDVAITAGAAGFTLPGYSIEQTAADIRKMIAGARAKWMRADPAPAILAPPEPGDVVPIDIFAGYDSPAPALRPGHVPDVIWRFSVDVAERMGVDPSTVALSCLVTAASVISEEWRLQPRMYDYTWTEQARLWGAVVGPPSILKTPVIQAVTRVLDRLSAAARAQHKLDLAAHAEASVAWKKAEGEKGPEPAMPRMPRHITEDATVESLGECLRDDEKARFVCPSGKVLVRHDEMTEFFSNLDRYGGGKATGDRGAYLRLYNGGPWVIDRILRGHFTVPNWSACFLGGIQPGPIRDIARKSVEDGLLQRFMYIVPWGQEPGIDRAPNGAAIQGWEELVVRLLALHPRQGITGARSVVTLHSAAHQHRERVERLARVLVKQRDCSARMQATLGKWPGLFARLTLVFHLIEVATDPRAYPDVVSEATCRQVSDFMREVLLPHLYRADAVMFATPRTTDAQWIAGYILTHKLERLTMRNLTHASKAFRAPEARIEVEQSLAGLVACGWLEAEPEAAALRGATAWVVNQEVHRLFAKRAEQEKRERDAAKAALQEAIQEAGVHDADPDASGEPDPEC